MLTLVNGIFGYEESKKSMHWKIASFDSLHSIAQGYGCCRLRGLDENNFESEAES